MELTHDTEKCKLVIHRDYIFGDDNDDSDDVNVVDDDDDDDDDDDGSNLDVTNACTSVLHHICLKYYISLINF